MLKFRQALTARRDAILNGEKQEEGFTLIELLIVVLIIGVLAAIAIPVYLSTVDNAKDTSAKSTVTEAKTAVVQYYVQNSSFPATIADADFAAPNAEDIVLTYTVDGDDFCITAYAAGRSDHPFSATKDTTVAEGNCAS